MDKNAKNKKRHEKHMTLAEAEELFVRALTEWPMNATRKKRVGEAIIEAELESFSDYKHSELLETIQDMLVKGQVAITELAPEDLWRRALDAFCIDGEQDWADAEVRDMFVLWLEDECGIPDADVPPKEAL